MAAVIAMGWSGEAEAAEQETAAEIAVIAPLSGELAPLGEQLVEAATIAAEAHGASIRTFDEGEGPEEVREAVADAASVQDVVAAIGPVRRRHAAASAQKAQRLGLPMISFSSAAGVERQGPMIFRARLSPEEQTRQVAAHLVEKLDIETVGVLAPRTTYGDGVVTALISDVNQRGARVTAMGRYEEGATDFRPALDRLTGRRAYVGGGRNLPGTDGDGLIRLGRDAAIEFEALVLADSHMTVARMLPFLSRYDIRTGGSGEGTPVQLVGLAGWRGDGLKRTPELLRGAIFFDTFGGVVDGPEARQYVVETYQRTDREPTTAEAEIADLVGLIAAATSDGSGEVTRLQVARRLSGEEGYEGVSGHWKFEQNGAPRRRMRGYEVGSGGEWMPARETRQ